MNYGQENDGSYKITAPNRRPFLTFARTAFNLPVDRSSSTSDAAPEYSSLYILEYVDKSLLALIAKLCFFPELVFAISISRGTNLGMP